MTGRSRSDRAAFRSRHGIRKGPVRPPLALLIGSLLSVVLIAGAWIHANRIHREDESTISGIIASGGDLASFTIVIAGIDSLTDGARGTDWRRYFRQAVMTEFGDGGPGWASFSERGAEDHGAQFTYTGFKPFGLASPQGSLSLDGEGLSTLTGGSFSWREPGRWDRARLFHMFDNGAGSLRCNGRNIASHGYSGLAWTDIPGPGRIDCTAKGQVSVFGALFLAGSSGLVMVNMARSGRRLADVALQDGSWRTRWFAALQPDVFILNAGTNDWRNASSEAHKADLRRVMNDAVAGAPDMRLMLVQHNAAGGVGQPNEQYFNDAAAKRELADELGIPLITVESVLGSYAVARSRGLLMDTVHPSDTGNRILGRFFARKVIEQISAHRPAPQP